MVKEAAGAACSRAAAATAGRKGWHARSRKGPADAGAAVGRRGGAARDGLQPVHAVRGLARVHAPRHPRDAGGRLHGRRSPRRSGARRKEFKAEIETQRPDERIKWKVVAGDHPHGRGHLPRAGAAPDPHRGQPRRRSGLADREGGARHAPRQARRARRPAPLQGVHRDAGARDRRLARRDRGRRARRGARRRVRRGARLLRRRGPHAEDRDEDQDEDEDRGRATSDEDEDDSGASAARSQPGAALEVAGAALVEPARLAARALVRSRGSSTASG